MSFLGGPECSTGANPLAQFQKQTSADTSLQRDRLTSRQPNQLNGFRSQQGLPDDAAFQDFAHQGPQMADGLPYDQAALHMEQFKREAELHSRGGSAHGGGGGGPGWAGEFAQQSPLPSFASEDFATRQQSFNPQDFASFRQSQLSPRLQSPSYQQQSAYRSPMLGGGFGMHRPMMGFQSPMHNQSQEYQGKGKARIQELSDTDWEKQFEELSTEDKDAELDSLDREAEIAVERELNEMDK
nr:peroxisomal targeting signal receptor [Quercus suber]